MTRRSTILAVLASPLAFVKGLWAKPLSNDDARIISASQNGTRIHDAPLPSGSDILKSFDARDWAKAFVEHVRQIPGIATDEETMVGWFANALMRGYDERAHWERAPVETTSAGKELPPHLQELVREFDPPMRDLGRGRNLPLEKIISLKRELEEYGFVPYLTPGLSGFNSQFMALYGASGAISAGIWFGFVREYQDVNQAVAFETDVATVKEFVERTGCGSLHGAINEA